MIRLFLIAAPVFPALVSAQAVSSEAERIQAARAPGIFPAAISGPVSNKDATLAPGESRGSSSARWAVIGAGVGTLAGLAAHAIVDAQAPDFCDEGEPGCTEEQNYSRGGFAFGFAAIGAVAGFALGARASGRASSVEGRPARSWQLGLRGSAASREAAVLTTSYRF